VQELPGDDFKGWVNCLMVGSRNSPRGQLPPLAELAFLLRLSLDQTEGLCGRLVERGLLDQWQDGRLVIHGWAHRQYESDLSTPRVQRFRAMKRFRNVSETSPDTDQTQTRGRPEKKRSLSLAFAGQHLSVTEQQDGLAAEAFPWVDLQVEYRKMDSWLEANPNKRPKAPAKFIHNWLARIDPPGRGGSNGQPFKNDPDVARRAAENFARRHGKRGFDAAGGVPGHRPKPAKA
jgi:hypothetical protein